MLEEGNFNVEQDLQELEKLLEESEYNEAMKEAEEATRRGKENTLWKSFFFTKRN